MYESLKNSVSLLMLSVSLALILFVGVSLDLMRYCFVSLSITCERKELQLDISVR